MRKTKIEWCDMTWNPVTGCFHGCQYCYARKITERFGLSFAPKLGDQGMEGAYKYNTEEEGMDTMLELEKPYKNPYPMSFYPTFRKYKLDEPSKIKKPQNIFVCSMADLFGNWVPDHWIVSVLEACRKAPQHNFFFLTKNPKRYIELKDKGILVDLPNMWYGTSITKKNDPFVWFDKFANWFISVEPILEDLGAYKAEYFPNWVIIGAETGNRKGKIIPEKVWIDSLVKQLPGVPVFMKDSLVPIVGEENMKREIPETLRLGATMSKSNKAYEASPCLFLDNQETVGHE